MITGDEMKDYQGLVKFIQEADRLKSTVRTAWSTTGRRESVAEHSWRLAMMAMLCEKDTDQMDWKKVVQMCLIHDLGEAYDGDIPAIVGEDKEVKYKSEERAVSRLIASLEEEQQEHIMALWKEYNACETEEAKFVKGLDKMETIIQHNQGENPEDFNYAFNLNYGYELAQSNEQLKEIRRIIDQDTKRNME